MAAVGTCQWIVMLSGGRLRRTHSKIHLALSDMQQYQKGIAAFLVLLHPKHCAFPSPRQMH